MVHTSYETLLSNKKRTIDTSFYGFQWNYAEWKRPLSKGYMLYGFIYMTVLKWQNYRNGKHELFPGVREGSWEGWCTVVIKGSTNKPSFCVLTVVVVRPIYTYDKIVCMKITYTHRHKWRHVKLVKSEIDHWI